MLRTASIFQNNMILQRGKTVSVWGEGTPGAEVCAKIQGKDGKTFVGKDGKWMLGIEELTASEEECLVIELSLIHILNKRISITPIALVGAAACKCPEDFVEVAKTLDRAAKEVGVNFIGGYSALVSKAMTKSDENLIRSIPQALAVTERICSSVNVGSTKTGINMDAVRLCGEIVKATAEATKENDSLGLSLIHILKN